MSTDDDVAFETLIYTDCVPGQGLQGTAGLQFQARSPGADRAAMSLVQGADLYEPPASWMRDRRPLEDYPPSFAHAYDTVYATAAGVYLGREANGGREGNQLTHAIVTADPASYLLHRPAQLFGAPFWLKQPAPTTECEPVRHPWEPGPFDIEAAKALVTENPRGTELLDRLLTSLLALTGSDGRRVLFISEDAEEVLRWISTATLLLPQEQALKIGFKVFTTNPAYATQPVVAVHPGWDSTAVTLEDDGGYAVFDLTRNDSSKVPVDPQARRWVRLLLDEDPYDVLDMVETAAATGRENPDEAYELARLMVLHGPGLSQHDARVAVSWLKTTPATVLRPSREKLIDKLLDDVTQWPEDILRDLDEIARSGQADPSRPPQVRVALISAELDRAARQGTASTIELGALPPGAWQDQHTDQCEALVVEELRAVRDPRMFDAVLKVAHRFHLTARVDDAAEASRAFIEAWADHPELDLSPGSWGTAQRPLLDDLRSELTRRVRAGHGDEVGDAWWNLLRVPMPMSDDPLDAALFAAKMVHSAEAARASLIEKLVTQALGTAPEDRARTVERTISTLWSRVPPSLDEYRQVAQLLPNGFALPAALARPLVEAILAGNDPVRHEHLDVLRSLYDKELIPRTERVERIVHSDEDLRAIHERLPTADVQQLTEFPRIVSYSVMPVRHVWAREITEAMQLVKHPAGSDRLLKQIPAEYHRPYLRELLSRLRKPGDVVPAVVAYQLAGADFLGPERREECLTYVQHWVRKANEKQRKQATALVLQIASRDRQREWTAMLESRDEGRSWKPTSWLRKAEG
ncbi:GTPase-associated protein 1-related protein [Nucisporomicrobium flavum]|uniref:GTPase-associated protein 1-related protein n=1 Tax=Nucisporomicrobium flavum TaxID=2785915 RepID=UPI0018F4B8F4|nr:GTPase-associated protein 1-related protein [Nucisporomicrobium flavum]